MVNSMKGSGSIHVGIGGWTFAPWRGVFYPKGLPQAKELAYAGEQLTSIEINGTYYGSQKPASFRKWASEVPDGFVFSVKGPRFATNRRVLAEAGELDRALSRFRRDRARRPARPAALAVRADQEIRRGRFRRVPRTAAGEARRPQAAPRRRGAPRQLPRRRSSSRCCAKFKIAGGLRRARDLSGHRRHHRRFRLCAPAEGRGHDPDRLSAEGARRLGRSGCETLADGQASRRICRVVDAEEPSRRPRRATCSPT